MLAPTGEDAGERNTPFSTSSFRRSTRSGHDLLWGSKPRFLPWVVDHDAAFHRHREADLGSAEIDPPMAALNAIASGRDKPLIGATERFCNDQARWR